jgi:hypothetical protein
MRDRMSFQAARVPRRVRFAPRSLSLNRCLDHPKLGMEPELETKTALRGTRWLGDHGLRARVFVTRRPDEEDLPT